MQKRICYAGCYTFENFFMFFRITAKVLRLTDRNTSAGLNRRSFVAGRIRSMNDSVVKDADNLHIAIQEERRNR